MRNFQFINRFDPIPLVAAIKRRPELWSQDTFLRDYNQGVPFGCVETIFLRWPPIQDGSKMTEDQIRGYMDSDTQHESVNRDAFKLFPEARQIVFGLMAYMQAERLGRVMINSIKPGGRIIPHADTPAHAEYYDRFHCVLQSAPGVIFRCDDEEIYMETGAIYWFQNANVHEVINNSGEDRWHMIVDLRMTK